MQAGCTVLAHSRQKGQSYAGPVDEKRAPRLGQVALGGGELVPRHHAIVYDVAQARANSTARFHGSDRAARSSPATPGLDARSTAWRPATAPSQRPKPPPRPARSAA